MKIDIIVVGELKTNCYILTKDSQVLIIDPGAEPQKIITSIPPNIQVKGIIVTHHHFDHIGALTDLLEYYHTQEYSYFNLKHGKNKIGNFEFDCIFTPGHFDDSITLYFQDQNLLFVGDLVFKDGIGRTDFIRSNKKDMIVSLKKILEIKFADIYPGHGEKTSIREEKTNLEKSIEYLNYS